MVRLAYGRRLGDETERLPVAGRAVRDGAGVGDGEVE